MKNRLAVIVGVAVLAMFTLATANGQENSEGSDPSSGVARISLIHGDVSTQRGDSDDWTTGTLNQPILSSDKISTGVRSRAELQLDSDNILRLGDNTQATVAGLERTRIQVQLTRGIMDYTVFKGTEADVEIDTVNVAIRPALKDGVYRVEVNADGQTQVTVRKGEAEISTPQGCTRLEKGRMIVVRGTADQTQYKEEEAISKDSWDSWNNDRDHTIRNAQAWRHTNRYYVGSEDLDAYGRWVNVPDYGTVWSPVVAGGWAPYRSGRWVWEPGWGWTWVSYEPWGWAPYHYGRWFVYSGSWVWWPGPVYGYSSYRPIWAPAYVSFFGFGGVGFGFGSVGWLPTGPCDAYYPWYGRYGSRFNQVNITNITNITNINNGFGRGYKGVAPLRAGNGYSNVRLATVNERVRQGVSTVSADRFGTGRQAPGVVSREDFKRGRMMAGNLPVVPTREALSVTNRPAVPSTLQHGNPSQRFFMKSQPGPGPQPFEKQAAQVQQSIQRNGQPNTFDSGPGRGVANTDRQGPASSSGVAAEGGKTSFPRPNSGVRMGVSGEPHGASSSSAVPSEKSASPVENQGWRRFGGSSAGPNQGRAQDNPVRTEPARATSPGTSPSISPATPPATPPARNGVERPSAGDGAGWRRFSDSSPAQRGSGVNSHSPESSAPAISNPPRRPETSVRPESSGPRSGAERSPSDGAGWRRFSDSSPAQANGVGAMSRSSEGSSVIPSNPRSESSGPQSSGGNDESWRHSTPRNTMQDSSGISRGAEGSHSASQDSTRGYSRPPLEMRQPIVTPRSSESSAGPSRGSNPSSPSTGGGYGSGGGHSQPSGGGYGNGGGHSQPSGGSVNHGPSGGGAPPRSSGPGNRR